MPAGAMWLNRDRVHPFRVIHAHDPVEQRLAVATEAFHVQRRHAAVLDFRQNLPLEAAISSIETVERHLDGVEGIIVRQQIGDQSISWALKTEKRDYSLEVEIKSSREGFAMNTLSPLRSASRQEKPARRPRRLGTPPRAMACPYSVCESRR